MENTSRLNLVTAASPRVSENTEHKRSSRTSAMDLLPGIKEIDQGIEHVSLQMGNINRARDTADRQRSPRNLFQLIPGKLSIAFHPSPDCATAEIKRRPDLYFFSTDLHERCLPFCQDCGPVDLGIIYIFWQYVRSKECHPDLGKRHMVYYTFTEPAHQKSASFLLGTYMMLEHHMSATAAANAIETIPGILPAFQDATHDDKDFEVTLRDCCMGLQKGMDNGWFRAATFDLALYEELEGVADMSLIGHKLVAFRGPRSPAPGENDGCEKLRPRACAKVLQKLGVTTIIRLHDAAPCANEGFEAEDVDVRDLTFTTCTCPDPAKIKSFLDIVDSAPGKVAVLCYGNRGRAGTMIALWMMKNRGFSAREAIAWLKLCRHGAVLGPQQHCLVACETMAWEGNLLTEPCAAISLSQFVSRKATGSALVHSSHDWTASAGRRKSLPPLSALKSEPLARSLALASDHASDTGKNMARASQLEAALQHASGSQAHRHVQTLGRVKSKVAVHAQSCAGRRYSSTPA
mmetsp:Transcript_9685/g.22370  ORF Transcript_9685/g.22370 Transcript_9685/m.22370 type:complete len:519 (+) Transcript_9685:170-1726(+)